MEPTDENELLPDTENPPPEPLTPEQQPEPAPSWVPWIIAGGILLILLAIIWFISAPGYEPLIAVLAGILGLLSYVSITSKRINWALTGVLVAVTVGGIWVINSQPKPPKIVILNIHYDGEQGKNEPDEYVEIRNEDRKPVSLLGWVLRDKTNSEYRLPDTTIQPGQNCRIYTDEDHPEQCALNLGSGSAIWNNEGGDCAYLSDAQDNPIAEFCYK